MRTLSIVLLSLVCLTKATIARADSAPPTTVDATLSLGPAEIVYLTDTTYGLNNTAVYAGELDWTPTNGSAAFSTYCIDISSDITLSTAYPYNLLPLGSTLSTSNTGVVKTIDGSETNEIELLWGNYHSQTINNPGAAAAFQIDIWQIIYGSGLTVAPGWGPQDWMDSPQNGWLTSVLNGSAPLPPTPLVALDSVTAQDQATDSFLSSVNPSVSAVPIPSSFAGGILLCAGMAGFARIRRAKPIETHGLGE